MRVFVTGASGFIGAAATVSLVRAGHDVLGMTRNEASARTLESRGARAVHGDLGADGPWQADLRRCDAVLHCAQPPAWGFRRVTHRIARRWRDERLALEARLLDTVREDQRLVYVAGTSYYGDVGPELVEEDFPPRPMGWGPWIGPAIEAVEARRPDAVMAFPGAIYGRGSWFWTYVVRPLQQGRPLYDLGTGDHHLSTMHVADCGRALAFLVDHGQAGRIFLVDDQPVTSRHLAETTARVLGVPLRRRPVPVWLARLLLGSVVVDSLQYDATLSNRKLKATGFCCDFPTFEEGARDVVSG